MTAAARENALRRTLLEFFGEERGGRILDQLRDRYRLHTVTLDEFVNLALREAWREQHGDTEAWDALARTTGFKPNRYEIGAPIKEGATA